MKRVKTKYGKKLVINISFKGEAVDTFSPKRFDSTALEFEKKFQKLDKGKISKAIERKRKDNNYLNVDIYYYYK